MSSFIDMLNRISRGETTPLGFQTAGGAASRTAHLALVAEVSSAEEAGEAAKSGVVDALLLPRGKATTVKSELPLGRWLTPSGKRPGTWVGRAEGKRLISCVGI